MNTINNRYCVILAGGVGSRFWPFSRTDRPKQFLDLFGMNRSLLQMTYDRFATVIPPENIFISTHEQYVDLVLEQLPEVSRDRILAESQRRNTAPCVAWAAYHIRALCPDATLVVTPADHLILRQDVFCDAIVKGMEFVENSPTLLTLGVKPSRPETEYGYIQVGNEIHDTISTVKTFTEKPNRDLAQVFVDSGEFFWNSGIFIWKVHTIIDAVRQHLPEISQRFESCLESFGTLDEAEVVQRQLAACPNISIDYGVMEKASNVHVLCAEFGWSDVGTWGSLYECSQKDVCDNVALHGRVLCYDSHRNIVSAAEEKLVILDGLKDYIVTDSENVLLICRKGEQQRIRQFVNDAKTKFGNGYV
ncbi:MAG: mannose-1-phosphate guanylyltransferase [Coprobacter sp.]|nr:mannose-1-phosphate guanylyltransferase [Coprobacter sp.]